MSDLDADEATPRSGGFTGDMDEDVAEIVPPPFATRKTVEREGLPASYRMRADAHYVDQLAARSTDVPLRFLPIDDIDEPDSTGTIDAADLQSLTQSVAEHGVVQPLLVRRDASGSRYRLIAGRKRLAAARAAALSRVPCMIHQVADAQADMLALASNVRVEQATPVVPASESHIDGVVIASVTESVTAIQSAAARLSRDGTPMARRVALDLVRAEAWRASWQLRAAAILEGRHNWRLQPVVLGTVLGRVRDGFAAERRLSEIDLRLSILDWNITLELDEEAFVCGVAGAIIASAGLVRGQDVAEITLIARRPEGKMVTVEVTQEGFVPDATSSARLFDRTWSDRPGGAPAMIGAAAAQAVAERHGGAATFTVKGGNATLRLRFARSTAQTDASRL